MGFHFITNCILYKNKLEKFITQNILLHSFEIKLLIMYLTLYLVLKYTTITNHDIYIYFKY